MKAKVLIVDDERSLVRSLRQILLLDLPDLCIDTAYSGEEALSCLAGSAYDLIIADLKMPGFDGLELVKGVRYQNPEIAIVLMTAYGSKELKDQASELGVEHFIDKPFDAEEMLLAVNACLAEREAGGG
jgi:YesN/AraC family two-component response regulator